MALISFNLVAASLAIVFLWRTSRHAIHRLKLHRNNCLPPCAYPHKDPFLGLDFFFAFMSAFKQGRLLEFQKDLFEKFGRTFSVNSFGNTIIKTIDPEVSKAVHSTFFDRFGLQGLRYDVAEHLWGNGIIVVDGSHWKHGRALIRGSFDVVHIANMERLKKHTNAFLELLPKHGSTVDLAPLFKRLVRMHCTNLIKRQGLASQILDTSSEFIFGEAMDALRNSERCEKFMSAFEYAQRGTGVRTVLGRLKFLHRDQKWWDACREVTDYADEHVEKALKRLNERNKLDRDEGEPLRLVDEMARDTQNRLTLRSHIISVFSPAHDGAATTLTNVVFHLARHPTVWAKLKEEISSTTNEPLDYELLNSYQYLGWVLKETHRLTTIATTNQRQCLATTILPFGGGPDGRSPLYIEKGNIVEIHYRQMGRDKTFWGEDAGSFKPERWEDARPGWEFTPFGGGPRSCPGQRLVFTESAYVLVTLLRTFDRIENRDVEYEWKEEFRLTAQSKNGCIVGLISGER